ncbi:MAG: serine/threonine-protein kinase, partial [Planctomycetota bacterium]
MSPTQSQDDSLRPGTVILDRYRIVSLLGKGGMGTVYRAEDQVLRQEVALKFLSAACASDPRSIRNLQQEVKISRQVTHNNVCRVYDIGDIHGRPFISMEYVDGEDLTSVLRRIGRLPQDKAIQIARQMCAGLQAAHDQG